MPPLNPTQKLPEISSLRRIICLANSWKHGDRCIAGIDVKTGEWIRPITDLEDGRISAEQRQIDGKEPNLLDILEIPLADMGEDRGFACENRQLLPGRWRIVGRAKPQDLLPYCRSYPHILHNFKKYVTVPFLRSQPFQQRRTLQLIDAVKFDVKGIERKGGATQWQGTLVTRTGQRLHDASITDPVLVPKLEYGYNPQVPCLVAVSLSMPHRPPNWDGDDPCWKLIAGAIEF